MGGAFLLAFPIGGVLGAKLGPRAPLRIAAALQVVNAALIALLVPESNPPHRRRRQQADREMRHPLTRRCSAGVQPAAPAAEAAAEVQPRCSRDAPQSLLALDCNRPLLHLPQVDLREANPIGALRRLFGRAGLLPPPPVRRVGLRHYISV